MRLVLRATEKKGNNIEQFAHTILSVYLKIECEVAATGSVLLRLVTSPQTLAVLHTRFPDRPLSHINTIVPVIILPHGFSPVLVIYSGFENLRWSCIKLWVCLIADLGVCITNISSAV